MSFAGFTNECFTPADFPDVDIPTMSYAAYLFLNRQEPRRTRRRARVTKRCWGSPPAGGGTETSSGEFQIRLKFRGLGVGRIAHARSAYPTSPCDHNNCEVCSARRFARRCCRIRSCQTSITDSQPFASARATLCRTVFSVTVLAGAMAEERRPVDGLALFLLCPHLMIPCN